MEDFAAIYEQERPRVFAYLLKCCKNWHIAEDLTSEVFLRALIARDEWQDRGIPYDHYLRRIAHWQHGLYWKKEKRWQRRRHYYPYLSQHAWNETTFADDGGIDLLIERCDNAMMAAFLRVTLSRLRPRPLRALALYYGLGLTGSEAARRMGISYEAFRTLRRGAIERLQQLMLGTEPTWTSKNARRRAHVAAAGA